MPKTQHRDIPPAVLKLSAKVGHAGSAKIIVDHWEKYNRVPDHYTEEYYEIFYADTRQRVESVHV